MTDAKQKTKDEAIKLIQDDIRLHHDYLSSKYKKALRMAIESLQTEIVRCEDCELWTEEKDEEDDILYGWCRAPFENDNLLVYGDDATRIFTAYDFFCKSGERREP